MHEVEVELDSFVRTLGARCVEDCSIGHFGCFDLEVGGLDVDLGDNVNERLRGAGEETVAYLVAVGPGRR